MPGSGEFRTSRRAHAMTFRDDFKCRM
jgi:hypothetical protein